MKKWLRKRLLTYIITGIIVPVLASKGVPPETLEWLIGLAAVYITGQSTTDFAAIRAGNKTD